MICFKDKQFCSNKTHSPDCDRILTPELIEKARKWWGGDDFPVALGPMCAGKKED